MNLPRKAPVDTLLLTGPEVAALLPIGACIDAVEHAFRLLGEGRAVPPGSLSVPLEGGGFHVKAGWLGLERRYFAAKVNGNFPGNPARSGLPTIQGVLVLCDADDGRVLALMDSVELTARRTAAATAVAVRHLARPDASVVTLCGCGVQARAQLEALCAVLPVRRVLAHDLHPRRAARFAAEMGRSLGVEVEAIGELARGVRESDVCVTCTTSREYLLHPEEVPPGCFVAGVGVDHPDKRELAPALLAASRVVTDLTEQCAAMGDLHHALAEGVMDRSDVHAELSAVVAGVAPGRGSPDEVVVFDSTGLALQDVAAAAVVHRRAVESREKGGSVRSIEFA